MKSLKIWASAMSVALIFAGCGNLNNTAKGSMIGTAAGGAAGTGIGALIGHLVGGSSGAKKGAIIVAAAGAAAGVTTGALIGHKMDKAAKAAKALENAKVESIEDSNGLPGVKVTFDNGILFTVGKSALKTNASLEFAVITGCPEAVRRRCSEHQHRHRRCYMRLRQQRR